MEEELSKLDDIPFLNFNQPEPSFQPIITPSINPIQEPPISPTQGFKAYNPYELYQDYPANIQKSLISSFFNKKLFAGIQILFGIKKGKDDQEDFLGSIDANVFNSGDINLSLLNLFNGEDKDNIKGQDEDDEEQNLQLEQLTEKFSEIQFQTFKQLKINESIEKVFAQNFDNFLALRENNGFQQFFLNSLENFYGEARKNIQPGISLIVSTFQFWMNMFKEFIREIWKHNEKYSLSLFKKNKVSAEGLSSCGHSTTSSSQNGEKDKRRPWVNEEIQILQKIIESNAVFSQARLQQLSNELNRSISSISSKIVKITKAKKEDAGIDSNKRPQTSTESKVKHILQMSNSGLTKNEILQKINQEYEMGVDDSWKNSVGSILSSSKQIQKLKPVFKLMNKVTYSNYAFDNSLKDRIVQCFLALPDSQGDIVEICKKYVELFHVDGADLKQSVSKVLARYTGIFDKESSNVKYRVKSKQFDISDVFS